MEKKKIDFTAVREKTEKNAKTLWGKAKKTIVSAVDQNDDGSLDMTDVAAIGTTIGNAAKNTASAVKSTATAVKNTAEEKRREMERKTLQPIFEEDLSDTEFLLSKLIRVTVMDKKRAESDVCVGSIGFISVQKDLRIVNIFKDKLDCFGLTFYPDADYELYYVDPCDRDRYIALGEYFNYLKVARVNELQKIAQDLGAKHFRVTYGEEKSASSKKNMIGNASIKLTGKPDSVSAEHSAAATEMYSLSVAAEMDCPGHAPIEPQLRYLQREPSIQNLIALRMDKTSPITHQKYTLKLSNSSGIKENDAIKIDAALKSMKVSGKTTVTSEVYNEAKRFFEYEIDF